MKVILLNTFERTGGAAIAANRLMKALINAGINAKSLVLHKQTNDKNVISVQSSFIKKQLARLNFLLERGIIFLHNCFSRKDLFKVSIANTGFDVSKHPLVKQADIIHLHWINQGFFSLRDLKKLADSGKPIIWTMHDQWSYTGICHYTGNCDKFINLCAYCPQLLNPNKFDLSYKTFKKKEQLYKSNVFTFVGCSRWIANEAKRSYLGSKANIVSIPNPIDITLYTKKSKSDARIALGLPLNKKLILFGACKVTDTRKGFDYMKSSCDLLFKQKKIAQEDIQIVVFGDKTNEIESLLPYPVLNVGYINDVQTMVNLYNAVDLFLIPSLEDNLPNTIMEAMACGTPCVGFNIGGIPEMIDHKQNGYVAAYKSAEDLAKGILWCFDHYNILSAEARKKVESTYNETIVAKQYIELYKRL